MLLMRLRMFCVSYDFSSENNYSNFVHNLKPQIHTKVFTAKYYTEIDVLQSAVNILQG